MRRPNRADPGDAWLCLSLLACAPTTTVCVSEAPASSPVPPLSFVSQEAGEGIDRDDPGNRPILRPLHKALR